MWLVASVAVVAVLTLQPGPGGFGAPLPSILNPFSRLYGADAIVNAILYVPVGFFAAVVWRLKTRPIVWATGFAFSVSLVVEFAQLVLPISRSAQFQDLVFNTLGGLVGALAAGLAVELARGPKVRVSDSSRSE